MSKAEERALEVYPKIIKRYRKLGDTKENTGSEYDENLEQRTIYIKGYHQAEKDLDISWIKEVSGVQEMSRAKEEALKAYPPLSIAANYDTIARRDAFEYGYLKAEKDLELTWQDMRELHIIFAEIDVDIELCKTNIKAETLGYYEEVLKRFKNLKK